MTTTKQNDYLNRLLSISSVPSASSALSAVSFSYVYNSANQRLQTTTSDGSYWLYTYDSLGQVTSGQRFWSDGTPVAGQQFGYAFDDIGNRTSTLAGGDENGANLRSANYTADRLNRYTSRDVPGAFLQELYGVALVIIAVVLHCPSCSSGQNLSPVAALRSLEPEKLNALLLQIDPWPEGSTEYSTQGWKRLIIAAKYVQECDPVSVKVQLSRRQSEFSEGDTGPIPKTREEGEKTLQLLDKRLEDDGKLLLLMRVVFEIPENKRGEPSKRFYAWRMRGTERNNDGTVNFAWPISWKAGNPKLVSGRTSLEGVNTLYNAAGEYDYFTHRYPFRDLRDLPDETRAKAQSAQSPRPNPKTCGVGERAYLK
jgi:hypothetical protein